MEGHPAQGLKWKQHGMKERNGPATFRGIGLTVLHAAARVSAVPFPGGRERVCVTGGQRLFIAIELTQMR